MTEKAPKGRSPDKVEVLTFEEHSSVLPEWWRRKVRAPALICLDAHLDLLQVNPRRLRRLEQCTTWEAVKRLEKPHRLLPDRQFSFSLEDFLYPAHRLGLIDRLVWVAPPHVNTGYSQATFSQLEQISGVLFEELTSFSRVGDGWIEGKLLGLHVTICNYQQLQRMSLPADSLIDIDTDYFVAVPGDRAWIDPRNVFDALNRLDVTPRFVTLSRSVGSGFMPVRYQFFADYLASLWENRNRDAAHYQRLFDLDRLLQAGKREAVVTRCQEELESHPQCPATCYLLSLAQRDPDQSRRYRRRAAELSLGYRPSVLRSACAIPNRQLAVDSGTMAALERQLAEAPESPQEQALAQSALGLIYSASGQIDRALQKYQQCRQHLGHQPELAADIGKLLAQSQRANEAIPFFNAAFQNDATRSPAHVHLAELLMRRGSLDEALQHLETARSLTPAWGQVLSMLTTLHQSLGNQQQSHTARNQYQHQRFQTAVLARKLSDHC